MANIGMTLIAKQRNRLRWLGIQGINQGRELNMTPEDKKAIEDYLRASEPNEYGQPRSIPDLNFLALQASNAVKRLLIEFEELRFRMDGLEK